MQKSIISSLQLHFRQIRDNVAPEVSRKTVSRRLNEAGLHACTPREKPLLSEKNIADRFKYGLVMEKKPKHWLKRLGWSDECSIKIFGHNGAQKVRRPKNTAYLKKYTKPTVKFGGGSIMVSALHFSYLHYAK